MKDVDLIWECLIDKSYKDEIQLELLINKIEDRKLVVGFLTNLYTNSVDWEVDRGTIINVISTYLGDTPKNEILLDAFRYFQNKIGDKNENQQNLDQFLVDFLTILEDEMSEDDDESDFIFSEIDTTEMENLLSKGDKNSIQHLKEKLLKMEMYEILPLIDKYL
jgi:hypothetical protein